MGYVYMIQNVVNNKIYIGSTVNYKNRVMAHKRGLKGGYHDNRKLQKDYDEYGIEAFCYTLLCEESDEDKRFELEAVIIQALNSYESGYNLSIDGRGKFLITEETRKKMSENNIGEKNNFYGKKHSDETRKIISDNAKSRVGEKNSFYGKKHSQESLNKIAKAYDELKESGWLNPQKGVPKSEEAKRKNALSQPSRKSVYADGKVYISISQCAKELGVVNTTVRNRINSEKFPEYYFIGD